IRGICCLRPGLPGISENIRVFSIVDRFLEHSRILVFGEGSKEQVFLSSADWMPRNFERRVEAMFPIEAEDIRRRIVEEIIPMYPHDNEHTRILQSDGTYARATPGDEAPHRAQVELLSQAAARDGLLAQKQPVALAASAFAGLAETDGEPKRDGA